MEVALHILIPMLLMLPALPVLPIPTLPANISEWFNDSINVSMESLFFVCVPCVAFACTLLF